MKLPDTSGKRFIAYGLAAILCLCVSLPLHADNMLAQNGVKSVIKSSVMELLTGYKRRLTIALRG